MTWLQGDDRQIKPHTVFSLDRGLTFGDAQGFQDAIDEQGSIKSLPIDVGLLAELLGIR